MKGAKFLPICTIITLMLCTTGKTFALTLDDTSTQSLISTASSSEATPAYQFSYTVNSTTGEATITEYRGSNTNVVIPATIDGHPVTTIGNRVFNFNNSLESVDLQQITTIGNSVFEGCTSLKTVISPNLKTIGESAFNGCTLLQIIDLSKITTIPNRAFQSCFALNNINTSNVTFIGYGAFNSCYSLTSADLSNVELIDSFAFNNTGLKNVDLLKIRNLGYGIFFNCKSLENFTISKDIISINSLLFEFSNPKNLTIYYGTEDISGLTIDDWHSFVNKFPALNVPSWTGKYVKNNVVTIDLNAPPDTQAPVIILNGESSITLILGETYNEQGATVTDNSGENIQATITGSVDTSKTGQYTLTYSAKDKSGNEATDVTRTVNIIYDYKGLLQPVNIDGSSVFKGGSTVPIKFQLKDANNNYVSTAIVKLSYAKVSDTNVGQLNEAVSTSATTTGNLFRYDTSSNQYVFNLNTKGLLTGKYKLIITLDDGQTYDNVQIGIR